MKGFYFWQVSIKYVTGATVRRVFEVCCNF